MHVVIALFFFFLCSVLAPQPLSKLHHYISNASQPIEGHHIIFYANLDIALVKYYDSKTDNNILIEIV